MKLKPFGEAPGKKLGVENDRLGPEIYFTRPKKLNSDIKGFDFCGPFSEPIYHQIHLDRVKKHKVVFALNANSLNRASSFVGLMHSFAGKVYNEDTTWNIDQITRSLDVISILLDFILRDFLSYIIK